MILSYFATNIMQTEQSTKQKHNHIITSGILLENYFSFASSARMRLNDCGVMNR